MTLLIEVKESKAPFLLELLNSLPYVKTKTVSPKKAKVLSNIQTAVDEMNLVLQGKLKAKDVNELLNEL